MIRHLLKLVWNRKRANALLIAEIFFSFVVVFAVATLGLFFANNYRRPIGFDWRDVWSVQIDMKQGSNDTFEPEQVDAVARVFREVQTMPGVQVTGSMDAPFSFGSFRTGFDAAGRHVESDFDEVNETFASVLGLDLVQGRWFSREDGALPYRPAVINSALAREVFGGADPLGKLLRAARPEEAGRPAERETRVIGVISDYRSDGELARPKNFTFNFKPVGDRAYRPFQFLLVKVPPGTTRDFEERLVRRLQAVAPDFSFEVQPLAAAREVNTRFRLAPLVAGGVISFFLLLMVGLGLLGVLWQNVLRRTRELGLRRALGAARSTVHRQVVGEQLLLTTFGVLLGLLLLGQLPFLGVTGFLGTGIFVSGLLVAVVALYGLATLCALYPSLLAGRVPPAEALRYE